MVNYFDPSVEMDYSNELWGIFSDAFKSVEGIRPRWYHTWAEVARYMEELPSRLRAIQDEEEWYSFLEANQNTIPEDLLDPPTEWELIEARFA